MSTQFNPQQLEAIHALGQNVIVSASAGAGKTTVLIARLMKRILTDGVRIDEICAMTFTEAAASEMKTRLLDALNKENSSNPSDFLQEQIALVETASISTIHSFCLNIIKNYGYIIGIDPIRTENILSPAEASLMRKEAMALTLDQEILNNHDRTRDLLDTFSSNPLNKSALESAVISLSNWILERKDPQTAVANALNLYKAQSLVDWPIAMQDNFFDYHYQSLFEIQKKLQQLSFLNPADPKFEENGNSLASRVADINNLIKKVENKDVSFYDDILITLDIKSKANGKEISYSNTRKELETLITRYISYHQPLEEAFKLLNNQENAMADLFHFTLKFIDNLDTIKEDAGVLDFSDFETLALKILHADNKAAAKIIKSQYKEIMVDEFQDTNEYQDEIIRLVSNGFNIFRVGDIKQSIYGFRGAKPQIMQDLIDKEEGLNLSLSFNYRSKKDIVDYNNAVFDNLMNLTRSNTYDDKDYVNTGIPSQNEDSWPVELHVIERFENKNIPSVARQTAQHIAQEIIRHHKEGMKFKDMVVLLRSHGSKDFLKEAFEEANIPHFLNELSGFYNSEIITQTIHLLNYALTNSNYYLAFVLSSLFIGMSEDDIALLALKYENISEGLKYDYPQTYEEISKLVVSIKDQDIVTSISNIISFNDVYQSKLSIQDKTNLDFLLDKAVLYQSTSLPTLYGFIKFIEEFSEEKSSEASPLSSDADVVTAMTIHQSKGLQFPLVFVFGMGGHSVMDHRNLLLVDESAIALNHIDLEKRYTYKNMIRELIEFKQDHDEIEEVLRLLYVALTRAQNKLIIVDAMKEFSKPELSAGLLRDHSRKMDLLIASSPHTTVIKTIDSFEIGDDKLEKISIDKDKIFAIRDHSFDPSPYTTFINEALNLDRSHLEAMEYGTKIHEAIEILPQGLWTDDDLQEYGPSISRHLKTFNTNDLTQEIYSNYTLEHEMSYIVNTGSIENGIMDLVATNDNHVILVDFKTDATDAQTIRERYDSQIQGYKKALTLIYPDKELRAYIYSFSLQTYLEF